MWYKWSNYDVYCSIVDRPNMKDVFKDQHYTASSNRYVLTRIYTTGDLRASSFQAPPLMLSTQDILIYPLLLNCMPESRRIGWGGVTGRSTVAVASLCSSSMTSLSKNALECLECLSKGT
jgi:hypothetical protein